MRQERASLPRMNGPMRQEQASLPRIDAPVRQGGQSVSTSTRAPSALSVATNFG